jgi:hypothetical protein
MWKCPKCSQKVDDDYEICWKCGTSVDGIENPAFLDEASTDPGPFAGADETVRPETLAMLIKCSKPAEAHAIRVRLESEGIPVFLFDEFTITMDWLLSNAIGGVKVQVPEPYLQRARDILGIQDEEEDEIDQEESYDDGETEEGQSEDMPDLDEGITDLERQPPLSQDERVIGKDPESP